MDFTRNNRPKTSIGIGNPMYSKYKDVIDDLESGGFKEKATSRQFIIIRGAIKDETWKRLGTWQLSKRYLFEFSFIPGTRSVVTDVYKSSEKSRIADHEPYWEVIPFLAGSPAEVLKYFKNYKKNHAI